MCFNAFYAYTNIISVILLHIPHIILYCDLQKKQAVTCIVSTNSMSINKSTWLKYTTWDLIQPSSQTLAICIRHGKNDLTTFTWFMKSLTLTLSTRLSSVHSDTDESPSHLPKTFCLLKLFCVPLSKLQLVFSVLDACQHFLTVHAGVFLHIW